MARECCPMYLVPGFCLDLLEHFCDKLRGGALCLWNGNGSTQNIGLIHQFSGTAVSPYRNHVPFRPLRRSSFADLKNGSALSRVLTEKPTDQRRDVFLRLPAYLRILKMEPLALGDNNLWARSLSSVGHICKVAWTSVHRVLVRDWQIVSLAQNVNCVFNGGTAIQVDHFGLYRNTGLLASRCSSWSQARQR